MEGGRAAVINERPIGEIPYEESVDLKRTGKPSYEGDVRPTSTSAFEAPVIEEVRPASSVVEENVPEYTEEQLVSIFNACDISVFYRYLKQDVFQDIEEAKKIDLFKKLMFVPVRTMFSDIVRNVKANDFAGLETLAASSMIDKEKVKRQVEEELNGTLEFPKDTDQIVEMCFAEKDPELSMLVFSYLIQYDVSTKDGPAAYRDFIARYKEPTDAKTKRLMVSRNHVPNTFF